MTAFRERRSFSTGPSLTISNKKKGRIGHAFDLWTPFHYFLWEFQEEWKTRGLVVFPVVTTGRAGRMPHKACGVKLHGHLDRGEVLTRGEESEEAVFRAALEPSTATGARRTPPQDPRGRGGLAARRAEAGGRRDTPTQHGGDYRTLRDRGGPHQVLREDIRAN